MACTDESASLGMMSTTLCECLFSATLALGLSSSLSSVDSTRT